MEEAVSKIFDECQTTLAAHRKCVTKLRALQQQNPQQFAELFAHNMHNVLAVYKREPAAERVVKFIVSYLTASPVNDDFVVCNMLEYITKPIAYHLEASCGSVRC